MGATVGRGEEIELRLLMSASQFAALEAVAKRSRLTVPELLRAAVGNFLQSPAGRPVRDVDAGPFGSAYLIEGLR